METDEQIMRKFDEHLLLNKVGMIITGIWPINKEASWRRIFLWKTQVGTIYFFIVFILCVQWYDMYMLWGNVRANSETFLPNAFVLALTIKYSSFLKSMELFREILQTMRGNWLKVMRKGASHNKEIMYEVTAKAHSRAFIYFVVAVFTVSVYSVTPFFVKSPYRDRYYPYFGAYYIDRDSDVIYALCYLSQIIMGTTIAMTSYFTDSMLLLCTYHSCAQLQILQNDITDLEYDKDVDIHERMISLIKRHQKEIKNAENLQTMFSQSSLQQILVSCLMICMTGFQLIVSVNNRNFELTQYVSCLGLTLFQILFYCQPGNELIIQSQALDVAIYNSSWVNMNRSSIMDLMFMMQRSQKPLAITAGKIYVLSLENFMKIVKASMSGLSLLRALS